jgi:hypothetical protein
MSPRADSMPTRADTCAHCGNPLPPLRGPARARVTCSPSCRTGLWERRRIARGLAQQAARADAEGAPERAATLRARAARLTAPGPLLAPSWTTPMSAAELIAELRELS